MGDVISIRLGRDTWIGGNKEWMYLIGGAPDGFNRESKTLF